LGRLDGVFKTKDGEILCLSHAEACRDEHENEVPVHEGMRVTAFDLDGDEHGHPVHILASGSVERAPDWLAPMVLAGSCASTGRVFRRELDERERGDPATR